MYLHFEDWSSFIPWLDQRGVKHGEKIIKVYASDEDPREKFNKSTLAVVESSDEPFTEDDVFDFGERGVFTGLDYERSMAERGVNDKAARIARALARFATREDARFAYVGMQQVKADGTFLIGHPLDGIHGWEWVLRGKEEFLHLDIFTSISLPRLRGIVDFENPALILTSQERMSREAEHPSVARERGI